ncbi:MAG: zinc ABC transporter substrate-binding protein [Deltaproteobacteria bacterium]|nr:zinc ABC transporter substrate-binding protein [Deltaproteobacteria bacterium]
MKRTFLFICAAALLAVGCQSKPPEKTATPAPDNAKPLVVCTTTMIADLARELAGNDAQVVGIMKPGTDPHIYEPRPDDGILFRKADLVLVNGLHLEGKMIDMIENAGNKAVELARDERIKIRGKAAAPDPHVWWNASYFAIFTEKARDALVPLVPGREDAVRERAARYIETLTTLHDEAKTAIAQIPEEQRVMVTSHDAFYYFGDAYGIAVDAVLGISTDAQARAAEPIRLAELVAARRIRAVFHETSVSQAQNDLVDSIKRLTEEKYRHDVAIAGPLYSDSIGLPGTPADSYVGAFKENVRLVVEALSGKDAPDFFKPAEGDADGR